MDQRRPIVAFGNPVYDQIETPFIKTDGRVLSGCSTNACLALSRFGHRTTLVGRIGADYYQQFLADLRRYRIDAMVEPCAHTGGFRLIYDARGDRSLDVLGLADVIEQVPAICHDASAVVIGPILQETPLSLIARIQAATAAPLLLDPQGLLRRFGTGERIEHFKPDDFAAIAACCRVVKANEIEARILTGVEPREHGMQAVQRLHAYGCAIAIVTLAEAGSLITDGTQILRIPAYATDARDPTGAGDTYMAGFLHAYLADPTDLFRAGCMGAATASIWIEHTGPEAPIELSEVERRTAILLASAG
jgi:sugar/nucleoside kinase (ribokinase family)